MIKQTFTYTLPKKLKVTSTLAVILFLGSWFYILPDPDFKGFSKFVFVGLTFYTSLILILRLVRIKDIQLTSESIIFSDTNDFVTRRKISFSEIERIEEFHSEVHDGFKLVTAKSNHLIFKKWMRIEEIDLFKSVLQSSSGKTITKVFDASTRR